MISLKARRANDTLFSRAFHTSSWYDFRANDIGPTELVMCMVVFSRVRLDLNIGPTLVFSRIKIEALLF